MKRAKRDALLDILTWEVQLKALTLAAYKEWLPAAQDAALAAAFIEVPPDPASLGFTQDKWEVTLDRKFLPGLSQLMNRFMARKWSAPGAPVDVRDVAASPGLESWRNEFLLGVRNRMVNTPDSVFKEITASLAQGTRAGESVTELRGRVQKLLDINNLDAWGSRAETVARTESAAAYNAATVHTAVVQQQATKDTTPLEMVWLSTLDSHTRRTHAQADGLRVPMGGKFSVGRAELRFPADPHGPPEEVINCRCAVSVLAADNPLPSEEGRQSKSRRSIVAQIKAWLRVGITRARDDGLAAAAAPAVAIMGETQEETMAEFRTFTNAVIAVLGTPTDDGRMFAENIDFRFRDFPLPVMWTKQTGEGHSDAFTVAVVEDAKVDGKKVLASGYVLNTPEADEMVAQAEHGVTNPSVDLGDVEWEFVKEDGSPISDAEWEDPELKVLEVVTSAKLLGFTLVATPAFGETRFAIDEGTVEKGDPAEAVAAAAYTPPELDVFPAEFFSKPELERWTPIHVQANGRVVGYAADWEACYVGRRDKCVTPYRSQTGYADFHQSNVLLDNGDRLRVGRLTVGGGHGKVGYGAKVAKDYYGDVTTCWAFVRVGEDENGIWVSGVVNPSADKDMVRMALNGAPHSGHWEPNEPGAYPEMIAIHAVNTPGFQNRVQGKSNEYGDIVSLAASFAPRQSRPSRAEIDVQEVAILAVKAYRTQEARQLKAQAIMAQASQRRRARAQALLKGRGVNV